MPSRNGAAHVVTTSRTYKGREYKSHLLRRTYREDGKVKKETLGNLSHLPDHVVELIKGSLRGVEYAPLEQVLQISSSRAHGHIQAIMATMQGLGFASMVASKPCVQRDIVLALVAARILEPRTKLATTRWWHSTTLAQEFGVTEVSDDDVYAAMDWLLPRQDTIEKKLARRHLQRDGLALYDLSSSYVEGSHCPLATFGYNRDRKRGTMQVNYGLLTNAQGCPVALSVYPGNTSDTATFLPAVERLRTSFGLEQMVLVGDRGMIAQTTINTLSTMEGMAWITALRNGSIRSLVDSGALQLSLFDTQDLFEFSSPDYPAERFVACKNPALAALRAHKREALLVATQANLEKVRARVAAGKLQGEAAIALAAGKVVDKHKMAKHFSLKITSKAFSFTRSQEKIDQEAALDGLYVIRTSVPASKMDAAQCVRNYKSLSNVERAFRSLKTVDLKVRPIHHYREDRVRAHIFLCMLAYYVQWHMQQALAPLLFADEDQASKAQRDPVKPAKRSEKALAKVSRKTTEEGLPVHSFRTLLAHMGTIVRNTCNGPKTGAVSSQFQMTTTPDPLQRKAMELLHKIAP